MDMTVSAWAVVDANGDICWSAGIFAEKMEAESVYIPANGERVVRVEVIPDIAHRRAGG